MTVTELNKKPIPQNLKFPTLLEIKAQIPKHLFVANTTLSLIYVARAVVSVIVLAIAALYFLTVPQSWEQFVSAFPTWNNASSASSFPIPFLASYIPTWSYADAYQVLGWCTYWFLQGTIFWGIFVLGHDCGHGSFSPYRLLNSIVGNFLHTFLLVPYESWKLSHRHHHKYTGNVEKDEVFYPAREKDGITKALRATPLLFGVAWAFYLIQGSRDNVIHFWPFHPLFDGRRMDVSISVLCWAVFAYAEYLIGVHYCTLMHIVFLHLAPVFVFGSWLVITTFLHHNDPDTPWYEDSEWDYVKGNLSSIDRSYWPFNEVIHSIGTHQIHHLFPIIPHYNLDEATRYFRLAYPALVRERKESIFVSFAANMYAFIMHGYVPKSVQVFTYRDGKDLQYDNQ